MFGVVLLVTLVMPVIYPLFSPVVMVSCLCVYLSYACIVELISTGGGQIMETTRLD